MSGLMIDSSTVLLFTILAIQMALIAYLMFPITDIITLARYVKQIREKTGFTSE